MKVHENILLEMRDIDKSFNGIPVLKKAHFNLHRGEVHALMGGNGAGKSTFMKILTGVYLKDAGSTLLEGKAIDIDSPVDAENFGIAMIFQEFSLIPTLTVAQNIFLKREPRIFSGLIIDEVALVKKAQLILDQLGEDIDPNARVEQLSVGKCQIVEIAKALSKNARILVMDEPTSSLSETEVAKLFSFVNRLKKSGISIIYISHRMTEIFTMCDRVTVMRDGENVLTASCGSLSMESLIESMLGSSVGTSMTWHAREHELGSNPALELIELSYKNKFKNITLTVYPGEVVGLAGLMGSGRTEILETIFGLNIADHGQVRVNDALITNISTAISAGVALIPENRRTQGLILDHSILDNFLLPNLKAFTRMFFVKTIAAAESIKTYIRQLKIDTISIKNPVGLLSGGNQQKVILSKWLAMRPRVLLLDEPTIGVDIGAKSEIIKLVRQLASNGTAVLVASSEFEELLAMSDRLIVLKDGFQKANLARTEIASEEVLHHAVQN